MVETKTNFTELEKIQSLEAEVNLLSQQLLDKDKQLQKAEAKLERQEKLATLGMLTAEIFHDLKNIIVSISTNQSANLIRLEKIEGSFEEAKVWLDNDMLEEFFGEVLAEYIPHSKSSSKELEQKIERMFGLTKRVNEYLHLEVNFLKMLKRANMLSEKEIEKLNKLEEEAFNKDDFILTDINNLVVGCLQLGCQTGQNKKLGKGEEKLNLSLNIDVAPAVGKVTVHEENLRRILINLVDNAFYTVYEKKQRLGEDYRPTISVKTEKLDDDSVVITVEDNGEGIEIGFREAMKPLVTTKPKEEGTGLGLSIVEKLCEESKIKLSAKTDPGVFTRFILTLEPVIV